MKTLIAALMLGLAASPAAAFDLSGTKQIALVTKDGQTIPMGTVDFIKDGDKAKFALHVDTSKFQTFFLSMRDFKCAVGPELQCYVPYPYNNPSTVTAQDLAWLEHGLLFFWKMPNAYGADLGKGLIYKMKVTDKGIEGTPQAINLDAIASPPDDLSKPPFSPDTREDIGDGQRWIAKMTITDK